MKNSKALIRHFGTVDAIQIMADQYLPISKPHQVLISIEASTVSRTDTFIRKGIYPLLKDKPPFALGYDFVGKIVEIGREVKHLKVGDRVADICMVGGNAEWIVRDAQNLLKIDQEIDAQKAACLVLSGMTAFQMFSRFTHLKNGNSMLIHGGAGAVGSTLLQLCKRKGISTVASGSSDKQAFIRSLGATAVDYRSPHYFKHLEETAKEGFDAAVDFTNQKSFNHSFKLLKNGGHLITCAVYSSAQRIDKKTMLGLIRFGADFGLMMSKLTVWNLLPNGKSAEFYGINDSKKNHFDQFQQDLNTLTTLVISFVKLGGFSSLLRGFTFKYGHFVYEGRCWCNCLTG